MCCLLADVAGLQFLEAAREVVGLSHLELPVRVLNVALRVYKNFESRPLLLFALNFYMAAHLLENLLANGEPEASSDPVSLRSFVERVEVDKESLQPVRRDADPRVYNINL